MHARSSGAYGSGKLTGGEVAFQPRYAHQVMYAEAS